MRILKLYVYKMWLVAFIAATAVLVFILVMGNFVRLAELVVNKGVELFMVFKLFLYLIPYLLVFAIPMAMLTSSLLVFSRLSVDNEITAMRASGISLSSVVTPILLTAFMLSAISLHLNDTVITRSHYLMRRAIANIGLSRPTAALEPKTFIKSFAGSVIFIYEIKGNKLFNVRIYQPQPGRMTRTIIARAGEFIPLENKKQIKLKLSDGAIDEPQDKDTIYKLTFTNYYMTLDIDEGQDPDKLEKKPSDMSFAELAAEAVKLNKQGIDSFPLITELHKKIAISFASAILALIAIPLGIKTKRREYSIGFGISLIVIIVYYLMFALAEVIALKQTLAPALAMWLPNALFLLLGLKLSRENLQR